MAYDRYDRDERSRWSNNDRSDQSRHRDSLGHPDERGFWDRASDEVASWFGDDEAERRRRGDTHRDHRTAGIDRRHEREHGASGRGWSSDPDRRGDRDYDRDQTAYGGSRSDQDFNYDRGVFNRGGSSERDYDPRSRRDMWRSNQDRNSGRGREAGSRYTPMTGNYGGAGRYESDQFFAASGYGAGERALGDYNDDRSKTPYGRDETRRTSFTGLRNDDREFDPNYRSWRDRQMGDLDRDYDDYSREHQARFEQDFTSWREKRQHKRGLLGQIREHMEVVGNDDGHVGKVDKTAGDRVILAKSDPDSGGAHHSLSCSDIDRIDGDKVILDCSADEARKRWRDESRKRALFEGDDQGEMGPRNLNRSFEGTYR